MPANRHNRAPLTIPALVAAAIALTTAITLLLASVGSGQARERSGINAPVSARELGITYGPYLGKRCRHADYRHCDLIGIDLVLSRRATRVVAELGGERIALRTPGRHNGIPHRDWVGNFTNPDLPRRGSHLIYAPIGLHVRFADGHRATTYLPRVLVSSGWG